MPITRTAAGAAALLLVSGIVPSIAQTVPAHNGPAEQKHAGPAEREPLDRAALAARRPDKAAFLGVAHAGGRLVAVGERGMVVFTDDDGATWRQARVPVSVTLTAVAFPTPTHGIAVGHGGVILTSGDAGRTWALTLDGRRAAQSVLDRTAASSADAEAVTRARRLVEDGPDKPFLGVWMRDPHHGLAVGAYGLLFSTGDGGGTWTPRLDALDNPGERHINAVTGQGRTVYLAGEQGLLARSDDGGESFRLLPSPYGGAFFAVAVTDGAVVVAGLRGAAFVSYDRGENWHPLTGGPAASYNAVLAAPDGHALLGNQAGEVWRADTVARSLIPLAPGVLAAPLPRTGGDVGKAEPLPFPKLGAPLSDLAIDGKGRLLIASLGGLTVTSAPVVPPPAAKGAP